MKHIKDIGVNFLFRDGIAAPVGDSPLAYAESRRRRPSTCRTSARAVETWLRKLPLISQGSFPNPSARSGRDTLSCAGPEVNRLFLWVGGIKSSAPCTIPSYSAGGALRYWRFAIEIAIGIGTRGNVDAFLGAEHTRMSIAGWEALLEL